MTRGNLIKEVERRQKWLAIFEEKIVSKYPQCAGKIQWDDVKYLNLSGISVDEAIVKYEKMYSLSKSGGISDDHMYDV